MQAADRRSRLASIVEDLTNSDQRRQHRKTDEFLVIGSLAAAEMDRERGEGGAALVFGVQLLLAKASDLAAALAAGGEGDHQHGAVAQIATVARAGGEHIPDLVAGEGEGAVETTQFHFVNVDRLARLATHS